MNIIHRKFIMLCFLLAALSLSLCACGSAPANPADPAASALPAEATEYPSESASVPQSSVVEITAENFWDYYDLVKVPDENPLTDAEGNVVVRKIPYELVLKAPYQIVDAEDPRVHVTLTGTTAIKYGIHFVFDSAACEYTMEPVETDQWTTEPFETTLSDPGTGVMEGDPLWLRTHFYTGEDYFCGISDVTEIEEIQDLTVTQAEGVLILSVS